MEEDERRLSFPPPAPLHSPGEEIDGSRLLGEIVRQLETTNPEAAAPLVASQSRDALDALPDEAERPRRDELRIPLEGIDGSCCNVLPSSLSANPKAAAPLVASQARDVLRIPIGGRILR